MKPTHKVGFGIRDADTVRFILPTAGFVIAGLSSPCVARIKTDCVRATAYFPLETHEKGDPSGVPFLSVFGNTLKLDFRWNKNLNNYNMLVVGGSGRGKSVFTNHVLQQHLNQKNIVFLFDKGGSYEYLVHSNAGQYIDTAQEENISFSPFQIYHAEGQWVFEPSPAHSKTERETIQYETAKVMRILTQIYAEENQQSQGLSMSEQNQLYNLLRAYYQMLNQHTETPSMTGFYVFCRKQSTAQELGRNDDFYGSLPFKKFLLALEMFVEENPYCAKGKEHYLLNARQKKSLVNHSIVAIDLQAVSTKNPIIYRLCMTLFLDAVQYTVENMPDNIFKAIVIDEGIDMFVGGGRESEFIGTLARKVRKHGGGLTLIIQHLKIFNTIPANIAGDLEENLDIKVVLGLGSDDPDAANILTEKLKMNADDVQKILTLDPSNKQGREYFVKMGAQGYLVRLKLPNSLLIMYSTTGEMRAIKRALYDFYDGDTQAVVRKIESWQRKYRHEDEKTQYRKMFEELEKIQLYKEKPWQTLEKILN